MWGWESVAIGILLNKAYLDYSDIMVLGNVWVFVFVYASVLLYGQDFLSKSIMINAFYKTVANSFF